MIIPARYRENVQNYAKMSIEYWPELKNLYKRDDYVVKFQLSSLPIYKVYLKSNGTGVTNNLFQVQTTIYMVSPSK